MVVDDPFCIAHAAVANLDGVAVKYFSNTSTKTTNLEKYLTATPSRLAT